MPRSPLAASLRGTTQGTKATVDTIRRETPVVVFDLDLTLTRWDTATRFFMWLLRRDWWRMLLVLAAIPVFAPLLVLPRTSFWPLHVAVWVATIGHTPHRLSFLIDAYVRSLSSDATSPFLPRGLERLQAHLAQGHRVVIATGCLEALARALLRQEGLDHVPLVASTLRPCLGGFVRAAHCHGAAMVAMLHARGFKAPWFAVYTDSRSDLPLLRLGQHRFLVSPSPRRRSRVTEALSGEVTVLSWRLK